MPLDVGYVQAGSPDAGVYVRVYYQQGFTPAAGQDAYDAPLINNSDPAQGPTGYCLTTVNTSGRNARVSIAGAGVDVARDVTVQQGNPVTSGQARSRTAAQLAAAGLRVRRDVQDLTIQ